MDNQNNKMLPVEKANYTFDIPVDMRQLSYISVIGVGCCGCSIVDEMSRVDKYSIPEVGVALVDNDAKSLEGKTVEEKYLADASTKEAETIVGDHNSMLFLVADLDEGYSMQMVTELCRQFHKENCKDDIPGKVSIALVVMPFGLEEENERVVNNIAAISKVATKVIIIINDNPISKQSADMPMCRFTGQMTKRVSDIIGTACRIFLEHDCAFVDYNDVAVVLQKGSKAIYGVGIGEGHGKEGKAVGELKKNLEQNGCKIENAKGVLLFIQFPHSRPPIVGDCFDAIELLRASLHDDADMLWNVSEDVYDESDTIAFHAIVLY